MQTKLQAIVAGLEEHLGLVVIECKGGGYEVVKKSRQNCKHRGSKHTKDCADCVNVPCPSWEYENAIGDHLVKCSHSGQHTACANCNHGANHVELNRCVTVGDMCKHVGYIVVKCKPIEEGS